MSILSFIKINGKSGGLLGSPNRFFDPMDEATIRHNFSNYDITCTINLKGSKLPKIAGLCCNYDKQLAIMKHIVHCFISPVCSAYIFYPELHKCHEWIHIHGILKVRKNPNGKNGLTYRKRILKQIRQEIFNFIEGRAIKKRESYKRRILVEPIKSSLNEWNNYIRKDTIIIREIIEDATPFYKMEVLNKIEVS